MTPHGPTAPWNGVVDETARHAHTGYDPLQVGDTSGHQGSAPRAGWMSALPTCLDASRARCARPCRCHQRICCRAPRGRTCDPAPGQGRCPRRWYGSRGRTCRPSMPCDPVQPSSSHRACAVNPVQRLRTRANGAPTHAPHLHAWHRVRGFNGLAHVLLDLSMRFQSHKRAVARQTHATARRPASPSQ